MDKPSVSRNDGPLQNHLVLEPIFSHLNISDLKACRLVCRTWEKESRPNFIRKTVCCIRTSDPTDIDLETLRKNTEESSIYQFKSFLFDGVFDAQDMEKFFDARPYIKELTLQDLSMKDSYGIQIKDYDVGKWNGLNLASLKIIGSRSIRRVPLSYLTTIKTIKLKDIALLLNGRIAPEKLTISGGANYLCTSDEEEWDDDDDDGLHLDQYVDVTNLKKLKLVDFCFGELHLDLQNCIQLERLVLATCANIFGFHNVLILKRLDLHDSDIRVNLPMLPPSVEELNVQAVSNRDLQYTSRDQFPYIKSLGLFKSIPLLNQCPNLIRLKIFRNFLCNVSVMPQSLKVIHTNGRKLGVYGRDPPFKLEKLVFEHDFSFDWNEISVAMDLLKPRIVVFNCVSTHRCTGGMVVCGDCGCVVDKIYPVIQQHMRRSDGTFKFILGNVYTRLRMFCYCNGQSPSRHFHEYGDYIECREGSPVGIDEKAFNAYINDY